MKIALVQINPTVGDFDANASRMIALAKEAAAAGANLCVFSEMCVMGYPARDLLEKPAFLDAQHHALERLIQELKDIPVILGCVSRRDTHEGRKLYNSCVFFVSGKTIARAHKCLLPTYDVFDEDRYFEAAREPVLVEHKGIKIGLTICEDAWNDKDFWKTANYDFDPVENLVSRGARLIINLSASPFAQQKHALKTRMLSSLAKKHRVPLIYVNQVGGNDDLIFDGRSMAFTASGQHIATGPAFEEGFTLVELKHEDLHAISAQPRPLNDMEEIRRGLVMGTRDYARKCGFKSAVIGLSGGIDSALVAAIAAEAFGPQHVTGVAMPSRFNAPESLADAKDLADRLGIHFKVVPIEPIMGQFQASLAESFAGTKEGVTEENIQARIRGVLLMAFSNKFGHLLLTTGNKSELATGYCTLYGDMCGGLAVISDLYKTLVYKLSRHFNDCNPGKPPIPDYTITRAPSAELRFNQKDQDSLPPYDELDAILKLTIEEHKSCAEIVAAGHNAEVVRKVLRMIDVNEYKRRQGAPGLKLTAKAFGTGRRMPIAQRFKDY
jgi:NAD+ synthase (glutamine-hydrolysing)